MNTSKLLDSVQPLSDDELKRLWELFEITKTSHTPAAQQRLRTFFDLIQDVRSKEEMLSRFLKDPREFCMSDPRYAEIISPGAAVQMEKLTGAAERPEKIDSAIEFVKKAGAEPIRQALLTTLQANTTYRRAALASVCLSIVYATMINPVVSTRYGDSANVYGRRPSSVTLVRNERRGDRLLLPYKDVSEQHQFLKATALGKLARDIYENPQIARLFSENPKEYLSRIGVPDVNLDPSDYEVKFALFLGTEEIRELVRRKDAKGFTSLAVNYLAAAPGDRPLANPEGCTVVAVCLAYVLVGGYNGVVVVNWVGATISLVAYLGVYAWTYVGGSGGGGCFLEDTLVNTIADQYKGIQHLAAGDHVASFNEMRRRVESCPVADIHRSRASHYYVLNDKIRATGEHPFCVGNCWRRVEDIRVGDQMRMLNGDSEHVRSIHRVDRSVDIYNLTVQKNHNYFVHGSLVHNKPLIAPGATVGGSDYAGVLKPSEQFAVECARRIGGEQFSVAVFSEIYKQYIAEAKRSTTSEDERRLLERIEAEVQQFTGSETRMS